MKTTKKILRICKRVNKFIKQTKKNYQSMKKDIMKILCCLCMIVALAACNVTRKVTTEQSYFSRGDTAVSITTKTIESYDATKKLN